MASQTSVVSETVSVETATRGATVAPIVASIAFVLELTLVPLLLPEMLDHFSLAIDELAWVFNSYGISVAIGVLFGGWFGDASNTKKVFNLGIALFVVGSLVVTIADKPMTLVVGRIIQGFGGGIFSPLVPIVLTRASPRRPGQILVVWGSIVGYVAAFAPLIYDSLFAYWWRLAFVLMACLAVLSALFLRDLPPDERSVPRQGQLKDYSALFRSRNLWVMFVYVFCTYGSVTFYLFALPLWVSSKEYAATSIGVLLSILWLSFSGLSTLLKRWVDAPQVRAITFTAPALIAAGLPFLYYSDDVLLLALSASLVGWGLACSNAPSTQLILRFAPKELSAISASLDITFARLAGVATVAFLATTGPAYACAAISLLCLTAGLCALLVSYETAALH